MGQNASHFHFPQNKYSLPLSLCVSLSISAYICFALNVAWKVLLTIDAKNKVGRYFPLVAGARRYEPDSDLIIKYEKWLKKFLKKSIYALKMFN